MTNTELLKEAIENSGMSITFISDKMGISREGFYKKMNNLTEFKASEIMAFTEILGMSKEKRDCIFFEDKGDFKSR